jgi:hypothetical protein
MKTRIVSTRIPAAQANGSFNILLPTGFGVPKGFLVYAMDNAVQPNNFDSVTDNPSYSIGFGGSNFAGTGISNICTYLTNQEDTDPTISSSSIGFTVSVFSCNNGRSISRQWSCTGFQNDTILGTYSSLGTQQSPLDVAFTVFGGDDFFCAVGHTDIPNVVNQISNVATTFAPDAVLWQTQRYPTTTDGNIHFGCAVKSPGLGITTIQVQVGSGWRNQNNQGTSSCTTTVRSNGTMILGVNRQSRVSYLSSSGIAFTSDSVLAGMFIVYMALKAGNGVTNSFSAGNFSSGTGVGTSFYYVGFKPQHILGGFSLATVLQSNTVNDTAESFSYFTGNGLQKSNITGIGTFTSSTSSTSVTGVGTSFLNQFCALDIIYNLNYQLVGIVSSITSNTGLLISTNSAITATGSSFIFEKPQQYSFSYGNQHSNGNGNNNLRGYVSDKAFVNFSSTTPTLITVGNMQNFDGSNGFTVNYTTSGATPRFGWYLAIKDDDFYRRRRVNS